VAVATPISINNIPANASWGGSFTPTYAYLGDGAKSTTSSTPGTCTVGLLGLVQFVGVGTCTLTAHATGTANYLAADGLPQSFQICKASPTISITNIPVGALVGGNFVPTFAYVGDGVASVTSSTTSKCTVSGGTVNFIASGTCTLRAKATGTANVDSATGPNQSFQIGKLPATVSVSNIPVGAVYGGSFTPTFAKTGNGSTSVTSSTTSKCTVSSGGLVKFVGVGTCILTAHVASTSQYNAANGAPQSFEIGQASPTISINNIPVGAKFGGSFKPSYAYTGDGLKSTTSSTPLTCLVSGTTVNFVGVGLCTLKAQATATANVTAAVGGDQSFSIGQATPTIKISNIPSDAHVGGKFTPTYSYVGDGVKSTTSSSPTVCSVSGLGVVNFLTTGTCKLTASATATTNVAAAVGSLQSFTIKSKD
jgi:hypothetical protein